MMETSIGMHYQVLASITVVILSLLLVVTKMDPVLNPSSDHDFSDEMPDELPQVKNAQDETKNCIQSDESVEAAIIVTATEQCTSVSINLNSKGLARSFYTCDKSHQSTAERVKNQSHYLSKYFQVPPQKYISNIANRTAMILKLITITLVNNY